MLEPNQENAKLIASKIQERLVCTVSHWYDVVHHEGFIEDVLKAIQEIENGK